MAAELSQSQIRFTTFHTMTTNAINDFFSAIRAAGTSAPNFELDTDAIIDRLKKWQSLCSFAVKDAGHDTVEIEFETLPTDVVSFARDVYDFCPDLVDQGTGCVAEMVEMMEETGEELSPEMAVLIEGVDFTDENYGLEILKREIENRKAVKLWWD
jgi:hypothetical protein